MAETITYNRINWEDAPSTKTPISAENLNKMDAALAEVVGVVNQHSEQIGDLDELEVDGENLVEAINNLQGSGSGLTDVLKSALRTYFTNMQTLLPQIAYVTEENVGNTLISNAQAVVTALDSSSTAKVESISCVYSGGSVPAGTNLDELKANLVVTAHYDDGSSLEITGYTLSGSIVAGQNTITVTYRKFTDTFTVTGLASYTITYNLTNVESSASTSAVIEGGSYETTLSYDDSNEETTFTVVVTMGGVDVTSDVYADGVISIANVTGDVVITAVAEIPDPNAPILQLSNIELDGTVTDPINTNTYLFKDGADSDWTVVADFTSSVKEATLLWGIYKNNSALIGISTVSSYCWQLNYNTGFQNLTEIDASSGVKLVVTHETGQGGATVYFVSNGAVTSKTATGTDSTLYDYSLRYGGKKSGTNGFTGTINDLTAYRRVLSEAEIKAYLGVA